MLENLSYSFLLVSSPGKVVHDLESKLVLIKIFHLNFPDFALSFTLSDSSLNEIFKNVKED